MTRLILVLPETISNSSEDEWSELRSSISQYPLYKPVFVRVSDGDREDWGMNETTYVVEHASLSDGLARSDPPHWCQNPTDQLVNSLIHLSHFWLRDILGPLAKMHRPPHHDTPTPLYRN